jgi:glycosyltransferase involved in cell wall biosynthesis
VEFDILHLHSVFLWPTFAAARVARRADVPYILAPRGMLVADLVARKSRILKSAWISLFEHTNVAGAAAIHVTSELEAAEFEKFGFPVRRMVVVMNGVEAPAVTQPERHPNVAREPYVLGLGRINWKKGFDRLIAAMAYVPNANLIIAGNDEEGYQPALERMIRDLNLSGRVRFLGPVYNDAKWNLLKSAALFALPSHSENFGIAALEAMACGCPVVVTPEVGLAGAIGKAGAGLVVDGEPKQFGTALAALLAQPERRRLMGEAGKRLAAQDFSWGRIAAQMEEVYQQCMAERTSRA